MTTMTTCMMTSPPFRCTLPVGHDGPHVTRDGYGWHDSDDMDGGVTAALIEKEAEESPSVDYEAMWWDAERRAEKAEAERDRWHSMWRQRGIKHLAAEKRATRAEAQADIRGCAVVIYRERAREAEAERDEWREASVKLAASSNQANADLYEAEARIKRLENRAASETARANTWRDRYRVMAGKRDAAHRAYVEEREARRVAEARIKTVQDLIDQADTAGDWTVTCSRLQWAIDGPGPRALDGDA